MGCGATTAAHAASPQCEAPAPAAVPQAAPTTPSVAGTVNVATEPGSPKELVSPKVPAQAPAVSSTAAPLPLAPPAPQAPEPSPAASAATPALYPDLTRVLIQGITKKPELNGQIGLVMQFDGGADRRYTVNVSGSLLRLAESKLSLAPAQESVAEGDYLDDVIGQCTGNVVSAQSMGATASSTAVLSAEDAKAREEANAEAMAVAQAREDANAATIKNMPKGELTATGSLVPTYTWVQVPPIASLPPGMEVWMPISGSKCARIPQTWRLQVVAEGQVDSYRCDVRENTPVIDIVIGAAEKFGWETQNLELRSEGQPLELEDEATVGSARLFGRKLTARSLA